MGRRTPAEAVRAALDRLMDQRIAAAAKLAKLDEEINEIRNVLGVAVPVADAVAVNTPSGHLSHHLVPARPAMAGERPPVDPNAPKKTLEQLMVEAARNPAPPGLPPEERPPFVELTQDQVLSTEGLDNVSPRDNMGPGRMM